MAIVSKISLYSTPCTINIINAVPSLIVVTNGQIRDFQDNTENGTLPLGEDQTAI